MKSKKKKLHPARRAVLRGLGVVLPPLLTIVVFLWAWSLIESKILVHMESGAAWCLTFGLGDSYPEPPPEARVTQVDGETVYRVKSRKYTEVESGGLVLSTIVQRVRQNPIKGMEKPETPWQYKNQYVRIVFMPRYIVVPLFLAVFIVILYLVGSFIAAGVGRMMWSFFEGLIARLPLVRNVYSSVKQVTDFLFTDAEIEFNRVVAVEYPRKGIWSIGFVTGESMIDISAAAQEPVLSVLMPTSPMPATGFTVTVKKSETVDLDLTIDQAIQFVVSCGVVVPDQQQHEVHQHVRESVAAHLGGSDGSQAADSDRSTPLVTDAAGASGNEESSSNEAGSI